ncbi:hypothetical protein WKG92_19495 [Pantoea agglomerans]|uniref:hypothetical protein n=1 Tax=Enterobacter agglomerans TaxID=549 RepID=UPI003C7D1CF2
MSQKNALRLSMLPTLFFAIWAGLYIIKHATDETANIPFICFMVIYAFFISQMVYIKLTFPKIPITEIILVVLFILAAFLFLHHKAEENPLIFFFVDFIILEVLCAFAGIYWRKKYYPEDINSEESKLLARIADFILKLFR